jgi:putative endonuclease
MLNNPQRFGQKGESSAIKFLVQRGYDILTRNYRTPIGEIDIIAKDGETLVFVEVKARRSAQYGHPKYAVTKQKQYKIGRCALYYLKANRLFDTKARFDVVTIDSAEFPAKIELIKNAFDMSPR